MASGAKDGSNSAVKVSKAKALRPRDAATLIIVDRTGSSGPRVLMGKRLDTLVFMPGKFVFPGGRVDKSDRLMTSADDLPSSVTSTLLLNMKGTASRSRARSLALAAVRETFEEAGLVIGSRHEGRSSEAVSPVWKGFVSEGYLPKLSPLKFIARAITPPGRPRRYDTRFFCTDAEAISHRTETNDGELSGLHWLTMDEARDLDLPSITRAILEDLATMMRDKSLEAASTPIPFYHFQNGNFRRELLSVETLDPA